MYQRKCFWEGGLILITEKKFTEVAVETYSMEQLTFIHGNALYQQKNPYSKTGFHSPEPDSITELQKKEE